MKEAAITFGNEVRRLRKRAGWSQQILAEKVGISREGISQIERGETVRPAIPTLNRLTDVLGLSQEHVHTLLYGREFADIDGELQKIAVLPTRADRMAALKGAAPEVQRAARVLIQDALAVALEVLGEASLPPSDRPELDYQES